MSAWRQQWTRPARLRDPRPDVKDIEVLRRLVKRAAKAAQRPFGDTGPLGHSAQRAWKARLPLGHQGHDSLFVQLRTAAARFGFLSFVDRQKAAPDLARLAKACSEILDGPPPSKPPSGDPPPRRSRADIDG